MLIIRASENHLDELSRLFNLYRIFYQEKSNYQKAYKFIRARMEKDESVIYVTSNEDDEFNPTLAAMETEIKPKVLQTINILTFNFLFVKLGQLA